MRRNKKKGKRHPEIKSPKFRRPRKTKADMKLEHSRTKHKRTDALPRKVKAPLMSKYAHDFINNLPVWLCDLGVGFIEKDKEKAIIMSYRLQECDNINIFRVSLIAFFRTLSDLIDITLEIIALDYAKDSPETLSVIQMVFEEVFLKLILKYPIIELLERHREDLREDTGKQITEEMTNLVTLELDKLNKMGDKVGKNLRNKLEK